MPKVNVYLPDELAEAVKAAELPVSAICQRALEQSVKRVTAIRATVLTDLEANDPTAQLKQFTDRARTAIKLAIQSASAQHVETEHLLHGILAEGNNLALRILQAVGVEVKNVRNALELPPAQENQATRFGSTAANALELSVTEALALGHNYVGCEHLLLGLLSEPDGKAGEVLRGQGVDLRTVRQTINAALVGFAHQAQQAQQAKTPDIATVIRHELRPIFARIERLEQQAGLADQTD